ncbi:MAG: glycosyltransferase family 2 protein [Deltaproteobacteria bacterium]|nr:glycosyltransferase family 2 protein [Deltaproteobacteria bacterium]
MDPTPAIESAVEVSVVVCTHNRAVLLRRCLRALLAQTTTRPYEVIVVENACTDDTREVVARFIEADARVRAIIEPRAGKSCALNAGLWAARAPVLAFTDDDTAAAPDWLERILAAFGSSSEVSIVAGRVRSEFEREAPEWLRMCTELKLERRGLLHDEAELRQIWGANVAFRKKCLASQGGFSEALGPVGSRFAPGEDTEAVLRVSRAYPAVFFDPEIVVDHWVPAEKMGLVYNLARQHRSGIATSRTCRTILVSRANLRGLGKLIVGRPGKRLAGVSEPSSRRPPRTVESVALWVSWWSGRVLGARLR